MSNAGWYPDPSGQAGKFRYWDGASWSDDVTEDPNAPAPGHGGAGESLPDAPTAMPGSPPPAYPSTTPGAGDPTQVGRPSGAPGWANPAPPAGGYGGYGQQPAGGTPQWAPNPGSGAPGGSGGGRGKSIGIIAGVIALIVALGVGSFFVVRGLSGDGNDSADDDESSQSTDGPTSDDSPDPDSPTIAEGPEVTADPASATCEGGLPLEGQEGLRDGRLSGGGMTAVEIPRVYRRFEIPGIEGILSQDTALRYADGVTSLTKLISDRWASGYLLGYVDRARGFEGLRVAAETALSCMEQSANYANLKSRQTLESGEWEVDGQPAYRIKANVFVEPPEPSDPPGDQVVFVVVDVGDPDRYGLYLNYQPLGFPELLGEEADVTDSLELQ